jgi:transposase InsO family protein
LTCFFNSLILLAILDGHGRCVVHRVIRETMTEADVEIVLQRAREKFPQAWPRIISDNGPDQQKPWVREWYRPIHGD